jgi:hypothetical protein
MAKRVSDLRTTNKSAKTSNKYLFVSDISNNESTKIALDDVFPSLQSGIANGTVTSGATGSFIDLFVGGGTGSSALNTNKSTLIFRGFASEDDTGSKTNALTSRIDTSQSDPNKQNIVVKFDATKVDANSLVNTTSKFLSEVGGKNALNLASGGTHFSGTLATGYGGTGRTTGTANSVLFYSDSTTIGQIRLSAKGAILTNNGTSLAELGVGTNGYVLKANSSTATGLEWVSTSGLFTGGTLSSNLSMAGNDILLGGGKISHSGIGGMDIASSTGKVYLGASAASFLEQLTVEGNMAFTSGDSTVYVEPHSSATPPDFTLQGCDAAASSGRNGGDTYVSAGDGDSNGNGGNLFLDGGVKAGSGTAGYISARIDASEKMRINSTGDVSIKSGNVEIVSASKSLEFTGSGTVTQATSFSTGVTLNATSGVITLDNTSTLAGDTTASFVVTNSTVAADSIVLLTLFDKTGTSNSRYAVSLGNQGAGSFTVLIHNSKNATSTAGILKVNFLVINPA